MQSLANAGAFELVEATIAAGTTPEAARKWWLGELARRANADNVELTSLPVTPEHVAALQKLVDDGKLTDKLARTVLEGVLAGEGTPAEVMAARKLEVVSDTGKGEVIHDRTKNVTAPRFPYSHSYSKPAAAAPRRVELSEWLTSKDNPYFAKSYVNRLWG